LFGYFCGVEMGKVLLFGGVVVVSLFGFGVVGTWLMLFVIGFLWYLIF
jgi:hypothetical protein